MTIQTNLDNLTLSGTLTTAGVVNSGSTSAPNGTAAAPSINFTNSATTGFFRSGSNIIGVSANGVSVGTFDANGFNGVIGGTTASAGTFTTVAGTAFTGTYFTASEFFDESAANTLTAAGTTRADALALTAARNNVTTAALNTGVVLPASATVGVGGHVVVYNGGANPIKVYAAGSDTIDGTAGSTGVTLTNAKRCEYFVIASGAFISAQLGATSA